MLRSRYDDAYLFFYCTEINGEMADKIDRINFEQLKAGPGGVEHRSAELRLTKSPGAILNIMFFMMARRAKCRKHFVTRFPTGVRLAQINTGRVNAR